MADIAATGEVIEPRQRDVIGGKGQSRLGLKVQRLCDSRSDRAAMGNGNDVATGKFGIQTINHHAHARQQILKAFSARRPFMGRGVPEPMILLGAVLRQPAIGLALPLAEILLGQIGLNDHAVPGVPAEGTLYVTEAKGDLK